jgi:hypothetical protein
MFFLRELKEEGLVVYKHIPGLEKEADIFTKSTPSSYAVMMDYSVCLRVINLEAREGVARFTAVGASTIYYGLQHLNMKMITIVFSADN